MSQWFCLALALLGMLAMEVECLPADMDPEMAEMAKMLRDNCIAETGASEAMINDVNNGGDIPPDPVLKCYIKCIMETTGMLSDGVVDVETILGLLPDSMRDHNEPSIRKCGSPKGADDCDTAFVTQLCWQKENKKLLYGVFAGLLPSLETEHSTYRVDMGIMEQHRLDVSSALVLFKK